MAILACAIPLEANADALAVKTSRGATVEVIAEFPLGAGPFPALVLAPGQGYHMGLPALEQTAKRLVSGGVAVYRFNWAYFTATPKPGSPSEDLSNELQDLNAVLATAAAEPRVDKGKLSVGGKSLGSVVAWSALVKNSSLQAGLFLTPICSQTPKGQSVPVALGEENYPAVASERRPLLFISGNKDPLCAPELLYRFAADSGGPARVAIVGGNHGYENPTLTGDSATNARDRNIDLVARLAESFLLEASGR
jgi:predicted alpha/beta-hydrolase family hydrolase